MRARKTDGNLPEIVAAFRKVGFLVDITNAAWDLTCQKNGRTLLIEVKNPGGKNRPTVAQERMRAAGWAVMTVRTVEDVRGLA